MIVPRHIDQSNAGRSSFRSLRSILAGQFEEHREETTQREKPTPIDMGKKKSKTPSSLPVDDPNASVRERLLSGESPLLRVFSYPPCPVFLAAIAIYAPKSRVKPTTRVLMPPF